MATFADISKMGIPSKVNLSATIKAGGGGNQLANYKPPTPNPAPRPNPAPTTQSGSNGGYQVGGWYNGQQYQGNGQWSSSPMSSTSTAVNQTGGNNISEPSIDWDQMYAPVMAGYSQAEATAKENAGLAEANLLSQKEGQLRDIGVEEEKGNKFFADSRTRAESNLRTAYDDAIRAHNALAQQGRSRFGGMSSAGQAVSEIGQQQFFRERGKTEQSYAQVFGDIETKHAEALKSYWNSKRDVEDKFQEQKNKISMSLRDSLSSIAMARGQSELDKNQKKTEIMMRHIEEARRVNQQKQQADEVLKVWKEQMIFNIQNKLVPIYGQSMNTQGYTPQNNYSVAPQTQSETPQIRWNPKTQKFEDQYGQVVS